MSGLMLHAELGRLFWNHNPLLIPSFTTKITLQILGHVDKLLFPST